MEEQCHCYIPQLNKHNKKPVTGMCYLLQYCWPMRSHKPHCYWLISEHSCWSHHTLWVIENGKINLILTREPHPYWLACAPLEGATYSASGEQLPSVLPSCEHLELRMTGLARLGHWHIVARRMGVNNPFLIVFEAILLGRTCDLSVHRH